MAYDMKPTVDQMLTDTPAITPHAAVNRSLGVYLQALFRDGTSAPDPGLHRLDDNLYQDALSMPRSARVDDMRHSSREGGRRRCMCLSATPRWGVRSLSVDRSACGERGSEFRCQTRGVDASAQSAFADGTEGKTRPGMHASCPANPEADALASLVGLWRRAPH